MKQLLICIFLLFTLHAQAQAQDWGAWRWVHAKTNVRVAPGLGSPIVDELVRGDSLMIGQCSENWCGVWGGSMVLPDTMHMAYIYEPLLKILKPTRRAAQPAKRPTTRTCCKICSKGKPCGDSCIARNKTCRKGPGCAC